MHVRGIRDASLDQRVRGIDEEETLARDEAVDRARVDEHDSVPARRPGRLVVVLEEVGEPSPRRAIRIANVDVRQLGRGLEGNVLGTWTIHFDKERQAFQFDKCENDGYCEERPSVIALDRTVLDPGGPLFGG